MFRRNKDTITDEFGVISDRDTGLLIDYPVEVNPIQIAVDKFKLKEGFIISLQFIVRNVSEYDQIIYGIKFLNIPDYFVYQSSQCYIGKFDKTLNKWLIGTLPYGVASYLTVEYKFTQPLKDFEIGYEIQLI